MDVGFVTRYYRLDESRASMKHINRFGSDEHQKFVGPDSHLPAGCVKKYVFKSTQLNMN